MGICISTLGLAMLFVHKYSMRRSQPSLAETGTALGEI
jgi:hypothetical protein